MQNKLLKKCIKCPFVTMMFMDRPETENTIYSKFLYENLVAQMITASGRELYYHTWEKEGSTHYYEIDFLISEGSKINAYEVKSSEIGMHESITIFAEKFSKYVNRTYLLAQKESGKDGALFLKPFYLQPFLL